MLFLPTAIAVTTYAVVWIEIEGMIVAYHICNVTTYAVVWIEILYDLALDVIADVTTYAVV